MKYFPVLMVALFSIPSLHAEPLTFESTETKTNLIELFSSEGCSSCPPAEDWVGRMKSDPALWKSIVPVVFHVDYWDHLGWPDRFASRESTLRQQRYAAAWAAGSVYTPGVVLNGREWRDWQGSPLPPTGARVGKLRVTLRDGGRVEVSFRPGPDIAKSLQVEIALLGGNIESDVRRGENSGRKLRHDFIVLHLEKAPLGAVGSNFTATLMLPQKLVPSPVALAAWVTGGDAQPVVQSTGGWLKPASP